ncbi:hypothetical protein C1X89_30085 [Pseudomonas sp. GP01-A8]|nr:hypothetical protein C1X90_29915 [Pseudomonas sp. GP01-A9]PMU20795.1 hypothetical protein C1X88_30285 [Pseudomonas sp. GP01-A13]PMU33042.1 hypothetical protein C1X89_30085 [Pseudomonas sp. GP01-A8]PMU43760.1 hypothetical protein C1X87_31110 [Pseudomonas sp. GP01-A14]PMU47846.1 hypothetical protein C1X85_31335 [Pseudomonas sp. GP01-A6]PMU59283.1 hypothetical protein C1X86_29470 [Pseudomonas sp. GP01-A3]PMU66730.1 hypothetical protein C1X81_29445 [Pseudomonas sp. FW215-L2]PMU67105.1 hypothe
MISRSPSRRRSPRSAPVKRPSWTRPNSGRRTKFPAATKIQCGSWLACDAGTSVLQVHRGDAIAASLKLDSSHTGFALLVRSLCCDQK